MNSYKSIKKSIDDFFNQLSEEELFALADDLKTEDEGVMFVDEYLEEYGNVLSSEFGIDTKPTTFQGEPAYCTPLFHQEMLMDIVVQPIKLIYASKTEIKAESMSKEQILIDVINAA